MKIFKFPNIFPFDLRIKILRNLKIGLIRKNTQTNRKKNSTKNNLYFYYKAVKFFCKCLSIFIKNLKRSRSPSSAFYIFENRHRKTKRNKKLGPAMTNKRLCLFRLILFAKTTLSLSHLPTLSFNNNIVPRPIVTNFAG